MASSLRVLTALNSIFDSVGISSELLAAKYNASVNENNDSSDELDGPDWEIKQSDEDQIGGNILPNFIVRIPYRCF